MSEEQRIYRALMEFRTLRLDVVRNLSINEIDRRLDTMQKSLLGQRLTHITTIIGLVIASYNIILAIRITNWELGTMVTVGFWIGFCLIIKSCHSYYEQQYEEQRQRDEKKRLLDRRDQYSVLSIMAKEELMPILKQVFQEGKIDKDRYEAIHTRIEKAVKEIEDDINEAKRKLESKSNE